MQLEALSQLRALHLVGICEAWGLSCVLHALHSGNDRWHAGPAAFPAPSTPVSPFVDSCPLVSADANTPDCYRPLLSLPVIEMLALTKCAHLPACLPQLSTLRALVSGRVGGWFAQLGLLFGQVLLLAINSDGLFNQQTLQ